MRRWWQLGIRNWRAKPTRSLAAVAAIALGVGVVVWVTTSYESVRVSLEERVWAWVGSTHLTAQSPLGHWGVIDESTIDKIRKIAGVKHVTGRLLRRVNIVNTAGQPIEEIVEAGRQAGFLSMYEYDAIGIDPEYEYHFRQYAEDFEGRRLKPGERDAAIMEHRLAAELGVGIGDSIYVVKKRPNQIIFAPKITDLMRFKVVGLFYRRTVGNLQRPGIVVHYSTVQDLTFHQGKITTADVLLENPSKEELGRVQKEMLRLAEGDVKDFAVESGTAKLEQLRLAERQTRFILLLISFIALFTAFFIILSTMSMGMVERITQLGMLRCVGMTRPQVAGIVLVESLPLGFVGTGLGIPLGIGLTWLCFLLLPHLDYRIVSTTAHEDMVISAWGIAIGIIGGLTTTVLGAVIPALQASRVSPLEASCPEAKAKRRGAEPIVAALGLAMIAGHWSMAEYMPPFWWLDYKIVGVVGMLLIFGGYALLTPFAARTVGVLGVAVTAKIIRVRRQLLADQVGRASWRSGLICCGLMVGLSLIVCTVVHTESIIAGWDFPKDLAEAFVWTTVPAPHSTIAKIKRIPGVKEFTLVNDIPCDLPAEKSEWQRWVRPVFAAGNLDSFLSMVNISFVEGDRAQAIQALRRGGAVLVTPEYASTRNAHVGDEITVSVGGRSHSFEIAGVVESPALDIAANFFNADSHLMVASVGAVLGTFEDARRLFGVEGYTLVLLNFNLPDVPVPESWDENILRKNSTIGLFRLIDPKQMSREELHRWSREQAVLRAVTAAMGRRNAILGSIRELKRAIDRDIHLASALFLSIPAVAMLVAALGVANLMMANVTSRTRQIAVLRALGATKWQIIRLVVGEALVLAMIGAGVGLALGLHAAYTVNQMTYKLWGYLPQWDVPWDFIGVAVAFTTAICLLAGILPARHAARSNIISALQAT